MESNAKPVGVPDLSLVPAASSVALSGGYDQDSPARQEAERADKAARYRLIIEEGPVQGTFVYKTLDSATGEIIRQFPREQVLKMAQSGDYSAGGLISTSA
jgi:flagellar protein FlaG